MCLDMNILLSDALQKFIDPIHIKYNLNFYIKAPNFISALGPRILRTGPACESKNISKNEIKNATQVK